MSTIIFPSSPFNGQLYPEQPIPGINQYQYNSQTDTWELLEEPCCGGVDNSTLLDNIAPQFDGTTTTFNLTSNGTPYFPPNAVQMIVTVGNIMQEALCDYTISGFTITFTTAPAAGLDCILLVIGGGQAAPANNLLLDDFQSQFDGVATTFLLTEGGDPYTPANEEQLIVSLDGIQQKPGEQYTVLGSSITFVTAPAAGMNCFVIALYGGGFGGSGCSGGGVEQIVAGTNITISPVEGTGIVTINSIGGAGSVVEINTGTGLTGGPITTTGTISLADTGVTPGSYTNADITVDAQGRITLASSGSSGGVTQIIAGDNITIDPVGGTGAVTICSASGPGGPQVFLSNAQGNIWSCNTDPVFDTLGVGTTDNFFVGCYSGKYLSSGCGGYYNTAIGYYAEKGSPLPRLQRWDLISSTVIPYTPPKPWLQAKDYYWINVTASNGTLIQGWMERNNGILLGPIDATLFSMWGPVINDELLTIPGYQIGGASPADDAVIQLKSENNWSNTMSGSLAIGNYAGSEAKGEGFNHIAIGSYAGQYGFGNNDFNHIFLGTCAGRCAPGGFYNTFIGAKAGLCAGGTDSFSNTFIGTYAGYSAANTFYQTFVGAYAGGAVCYPGGWCGGGNQLFGAFSGAQITTGYQNSMFGLYAGYCVTTGTNNSIFGHFASGGITTGIYNSSFGAYAGPEGWYEGAFGWLTNTGSYNTSIGSFASFWRAGNSSYNTAVGQKSLFGTSRGLRTVTTGGGTALASQANCSYIISTDCFSSTSPPPCTGSPGKVKVYRDGVGLVCDIEVIDPGFLLQCRVFSCIPGNLIGGSAPADNIFISRTLTTTNNSCNFHNTLLGSYAGEVSCRGTRNFFGGYRSGGWSGYCCPSIDNVAIGSYAGFRTGGSNNVMVGTQAGYRNYCASSNIFIGDRAGGGSINTSGSNNTFIGRQAGYVSTTGCNNNFIGHMSGRSNTTGSYNNLIGYCSGYSNISGSYNNIFGYLAGRCNTYGRYNTFIGAVAGEQNTNGCYNTYSGYLAGQWNTTGIRNSFFGHLAGQCSLGSFNVGIGNGALRFDSGNYNAALGHFAGGNGSRPGAACNIYIGYYSGPINGNQTGTNNIFMGYRAGCATANASASSNNILIGCLAGADAVFNLTTESNRIVLGNNSHTNAYVKVGWTVTSDERDKTCVKALRHGGEFLDKLSPVQFHWKDRDTGEVTDETPRYGFLAQEILDAEGDPAVLVDNQDPNNLKLRETQMIPILVNAIKELNAKYETLAEELATIKSQLI